MIKKILLRLYPAAWREEYGEEFADVLSAQRLGAGTIADVICGVAWQRLRYAPQWLLAGAFIAVVSLIELMLGDYGVLSHGHNLALSPVVNMVLTMTGVLLAARKKSSFFGAVAGTVKVGLVGAIPGLLRTMLWSGSTFAITVFDQTIVARRLNAWPPTLSALGFVVIYSAILGVCGAFGGRMMLRYRGQAACQRALW